MTVAERGLVYPEIDEQMRYNREAEHLLADAFAQDERESGPTQAIRFTDVTLRDGMQQQDMYLGETGPDGKPEGLSVEDRLTIFDAIVDSGVNLIEVGHFGNDADGPFGKALVTHIKDKIAQGDSRYDSVRIQVLFGADAAQVEKGVKVLEGFDKDRVVVHMYNRISPGLRALASNQPNTPKKSADDLCVAAQAAIDYGYTQFSVSGEGAVDHRQDMRVSIDYHNQITAYLLEHRAQSVNVNLANTFGVSPEGEWDQEGLAEFNQQVRVPGRLYPDRTITTSVHTHNDYGSGADFAMAALNAGFDTVEGAFIGMGERAGNVSLVDTFVRLAERASIDVEIAERLAADGTFEDGAFANRALARSIWRHRHMPASLTDNMHKWYTVAQTIADTAQTGRFEMTALGRTTAFDAGSGPHGEANRKYGEGPTAHRLYEHYGRIAAIFGMFGNPAANAILDVDADSMKAITVLNHAAGGSTKAMHNDTFSLAPRDAREASRALVDARHEVTRAYMTHTLAA